MTVGDTELWERLAACDRHRERRQSQLLEAHGLTPPQFALLEALANGDPPTLGELGRRLDVSAGNVTVIVQNLEKAGLVQREQAAGDRRLTHASLTAAGHDRLTHARADWRALSERLTAPVTPEEAQILTLLLAKLSRAASSD